jgi:nicotinamidase-related amidase
MPLIHQALLVSNTARAALQLGYRVQLAQGARSSWPSQGRGAAGATLASTDQLHARLATSPPRLGARP